MTKFVLVIVMLLPTGQVETTVSTNDYCPEKDSVITYYDNLKLNNEIIDYRLSCLQAVFNNYNKI
jgi:hypothetical protein